MTKGVDETTQLQLVRQEFSRAEAYADEYQGKTPIAHFFNTRIRRVSELLGHFDSGRILDVGCGPAVICSTFRGKAIDYYGVDVSEDMIRNCLKSFGDDPRFHFSVGTMQDLEFASESFDIVLSLGALENVLDGDAALRELARVLKQDGILIVTMLNDWSPHNLWKTYVYWKFLNVVNRFVRCLRKAATDLQKTDPASGKRSRSVAYREKKLSQMLTSAGLEVEDTLYYGFNVIPSPLDKMFPRSSVSISRKLEVLCRSALRFLGTGYMARCIKAGLEHE